MIRGRDPVAGHGSAIVYVFTTAIHNSLLGLLLTFSPTAWYTPYASTTAAWGLTPLEDQQIGGLIMWVPAGIVYLAAGLMFTVAWMRESEIRLFDRARYGGPPAGPV